MKSERTLYQILYDELKSQILAGTLKSGDFLPPLSQLSGQYQMGLHTVRRALSLLHQDGFIYIQKGVRAQVTYTQQSTNTNGVVMLLQKKHAIRETLDFICTFFPQWVTLSAQYSTPQQIDHFIERLQSLNLWEQAPKELFSEIEFINQQLIANLHNPLLSDLCNAMRQFITMPYINKENLTYPYSKTSAYFKDIHLEMLFLLKERQFDKFRELFSYSCKLFIPLTEDYLKDLSGEVKREEIKTSTPFQWASNKGDSFYYSYIALDLIKDIDRGLYSDHGRLPSIIEMEKKYAVTRNTARRALLLLSHIGLIDPDKGNGFRLDLKKTRQYQINIQDPFYRKNILLCLQANQILNTMMPCIVKEQFERLPYNKIADSLKKVSEKDSFREKMTVTHSLFLSMTNITFSDSLHTVLQELTRPLIWGYVMKYFRISPKVYSYFEQYYQIIAESFLQKDKVTFSSAFCNLHTFLHHNMKEKLLALGLTEAADLRP